jgi:hypothetical protein
MDILWFPRGAWEPGDSNTHRGPLAPGWAAQNWLGEAKTGIGGKAEFCSIIVQFFATVQTTRRTRMLASMDVDQYRSPRKKLLRFFVGSRDGWKAKCAEANEDRKLMANQVRAVEKSREQWRTLAEERKRQIAELEQELAELKRTST